MSMLFKRFKDWAVSITSFRTGDVIPVDGPNGTAKMSKDDLLKETAQNALAGNVAPDYVKQAYPANSYVIHDGRLYSNPNAIATAEDWNLAHWDETIISEHLNISDGSFLDGLPEGDVEQIGDKIYKVGLMPDGNIWMCENLDYGSDGVYYNNDEPTYGWNGLMYGKLYTWDEAVAAGSAISGWHLPSKAEWDALATAVGGSNIAGTKLKSTTRWTTGNGTDDYGFEVFPSGDRSSGSFNNLGNRAYFWAANEYSSSQAYRCNFDTGASMYSFGSSKSNGYSVRLVKD